MAGKKKQGGKGGSSGNPNWKPYLYAAGVCLLALAVYSAIFVAPRPPQSAPSSKREAPRQSIEELEAQVRKMRDGIGGISGNGESKVFKTLKTMADTLDKVLADSQAAPTEEERRRILEAGLATKVDMLQVLADRSQVLLEEGAAEEAKNAPLSLDGSKHVAKLTQDSFPAYIGRHPHAMVEFYAPWCGHCKELAPHYEILAQQFEGRAGFAAIDGTAEQQLSRVFNIGGYPTLKWFVRSRPIDYEGPRTKDAIAEWVEGRLTPAYSDVDPSDDIAGAVESSSSSDAKILAGSGSKESELFKAFEAVAEKFRGTMLFVWAPEGFDHVTLYRTGRNAVACDEASACTKADALISWLDNNLKD